jgi:hypothetical protein
MEIGYYDLIELPSGRHIPAPIAVELVGTEEIRKIPVARKKRDHEFFFCPHCGESDFFKHYCCADCTDDYCDECPDNPDKTEKQIRLKELAFVQLIKNKQYRKLRYIRSIY